MPKDMGTYRAWVRDAVLRCSAKGVHEYAIENEINSKSFWAGTPQEFATLAETAAKEIRAADRNALVVDAGLSSTTYGYGLSKWLLEQGREADAITAYNRYHERFPGRAATRSWRSATVPRLEQALTSERGARNLTYLALMNDLARRKVVDVRQIHFYEAYSSVPAPVLLPAYGHPPAPRSGPGRSGASPDRRRGDRRTGRRDAEDHEPGPRRGRHGGDLAPLGVRPCRSLLGQARSGCSSRTAGCGRAGRLFRALPDASRGARVVKVDDAELRGRVRSPAAPRPSCGPTTRSPSTWVPAGARRSGRPRRAAAAGVTVDARKAAATDPEEPGQEASWRSGDGLPSSSLVFVGGLHRGGTTFWRVLAEHPGIAALTATRVRRTRGNTSSRLPEGQGRRRSGQFAFDARAHLTESHSRHPRAPSPTAAWEPFWDNTPCHLAEKSPPTS